MLSSLVSKTPVVCVSLEEEDILVRPSIDPDQPTADPILRGRVLIKLASSRTVKRVKVVLEGLCDVSGKSSAHSQVGPC